MFDKVLVLSDGGDALQPALRRALSIVSDEGVIEILAVVYEPMLEGYLGNKDIYEPLRRRVLDEHRDRVSALARTVEARGVKSIGDAVWSHPLHRAVAAAANARGIDLVVAAPTSLHQGGGAPHRGLAHSDWQVITHCSAPLLIVKSDGHTKYRHIVAAVDPFHRHAKPAELDAEILRHAKTMQALTGAALTVLHCYLPVDYFGADLSDLPAREPDFVDARQEALNALCAAADIPAAASRLVAGTPHTVLQTLQERGEADLIVMGALARGRFAELIVGNTAERVLHHASADVLVVTPRTSPPAR